MQLQKRCYTCGGLPPVSIKLLSGHNEFIDKLVEVAPTQPLQDLLCGHYGGLPVVVCILRQAAKAWLRDTPVLNHLSKFQIDSSVV